MASAPRIGGCRAAAGGPHRWAREGSPMLELIGLIVVLWFLWEKIIGA
ncbi:MAG: hypothetical protein FWJ83_05165 [Limnochordales bacterium]